MILFETSTFSFIFINKQMNSLSDNISYYLTLTVKNDIPRDLNSFVFISNNAQPFRYSSTNIYKFNIYAQDFVTVDNYLMTFYKGIFYIYKFKSTKKGVFNKKDNIEIKLYKTITISALLYYKFNKGSIRRFFMKILLRIMHISRFDCYLEGIMNYLDVENMDNVTEYKNGVKIRYKDGTIKYFDEFLKETTVENLKEAPNNFVQENFLIKVNKDSVLIFRDDTNFINKKRINVKKYALNRNVLFIITESGKLIAIEHV